MRTNYNKEEQYLRAKEKVGVIKGFYAHLVTFIIVIPILITINLQYVPHFHWFWFPVLGWGFGLLSHWMEAFDRHFLFGKGWEKRKIKEFMDKDKY